MTKLRSVRIYPLPLTACMPAVLIYSDILMPDVQVTHSLQRYTLPSFQITST